MMGRTGRWRAVCWIALLGLPGWVTAAEPTAEQVRFFEMKIRPVLVEQCFKCHSAQKQWGNLRLDSHAALLRGGDSGPALVPGKPAESRLLRAIQQVDDDLKMPPEGRLTPQQIADFAKWIEQGAAFPGGKAADERKRDPEHWAFQPPADPQPPTVENASWPRRPLDQFILARLEAAGLAPAPRADRRTLLRRLTFDLTGLPPTPAELADFLADDRPDADVRLVDRLLASPAYGERWGRHWLDVARYADSNGLDENVCHGNAWRYRDYVVDAWNRDVPYDRFVLEQLAGDLLPAEDDQSRGRLLIATGFLALGPKVLAEVDEGKMQMDIVDEQIETVGRSLLGMTFGCARCHDHKFDPIDTADYYGLAGIFKSTHTMESFKKVAKWYEHPLPSPESRAAKAAYDSQVAAKKAEIAAFVARADAEVKASAPAGEPLPEKLETRYSAETKAALKTLRDALTQLEKNPPELASAMGVGEAEVADVAIHIRGNPLKLGAVVPRRTPPVFRGPESPHFSAEHSGRLELAQWLIDPRHPLTARVLANRVWRWHFGKGLVRTPDNFGLLGEPPTHPELLDWLAHRLIAGGWSLKDLHREIVLSSTYQQSSRPDAAALERDPENRLYSRADVRRLEAEAVRDALLAVSGQLDLALGGSLLTVKNRAYFFDHTSRDLTDYSSTRRSLYLPVVRNNVYDLFQLLDFPDAAVPSGDRATTTVAPQALFMLNSDFVAQSSAAFATSLLDGRRADDAARIQRIYLAAYARPATAEEAAAGAALLRDIERTLPADGADAHARERLAWECFCQTVLAANEFIYVE